MAKYYATGDTITVGGNHYYGVVYEAPRITRTLGGDSLSGFVEYSDIEFEMFQPQSGVSPIGGGGFILAFLQDQFRHHPVKVEFREGIGGSILTEWYGRITEDALIDSGGLRLRGSGFPRDVLAQRIPPKFVTLDDFPNAVDSGKCVPYVMGSVNKLRLPYVNDGGSGNFDYILMLGQYAALYNLYLDTVNQSPNLPNGNQSFQGISPADYTPSIQTAASGYEYTRIRFTARQVNTSGALVGVYADLRGDDISRASPIEAVQAILTHPSLLNLTVDTASFAAAKTAFANITSPHSVSVDGVLGRDGQPQAAQDYLRPLLRMCHGWLGINSSGQFTIELDLPPSAVKMTIGAGPNVAVNNLISPGTRRHLPESSRPKRYVLDYRLDLTTGVTLFQRARSIYSTGQDVTESNPFISDHRTADIIVSRAAKILTNEQDMVEGTVASIDARILNQGDVFYYTWGGHGAEDDLRKVISITKELHQITINHRRYGLDEFRYTAEALPVEYVPPINAPPAVPANILLENSGPNYLVTNYLLVTTTYQTVADHSITIDTNGNDLKKWAFVQVMTSVGGVSTDVSFRLRNTNTGANIVQTVTLVADSLIYAPHTVYKGTFNLSQNELGVNAGAHQVLLEVKVVSSSHFLWIGSLNKLIPNGISDAFVQIQEWS